MRDIITDQRAQRIPAQVIRERLGRLTSDQLEAGLLFLSGYDPDLFDLVVHAAQTWDDSDSSGASDSSVLG